jgi:hypothetical protein
VRQHEQAQDRKGQRQDPTEAYLSAKPAPHASNTIYHLPFLKLQSNDCEAFGDERPGAEEPKELCKICAQHYLWQLREIERPRRGTAMRNSSSVLRSAGYTPFCAGMTMTFGRGALLKV